jgi:hypothetical protein
MKKFLLLLALLVTGWAGGYVHRANTYPNVFVTKTAPRGGYVQIGWTRDYFWAPWTFDVFLIFRDRNYSLKKKIILMRFLDSKEEVSEYFHGLTIQKDLVEIQASESYQGRRVFKTE